MIERKKPRARAWRGSLFQAAARFAGNSAVLMRRRSWERPSRSKGSWISLLRKTESSSDVTSIAAMLLDLLDRPPARSACSVQRQLAARFDGEVAGGAVADFFFVILRFGATMELGRSGR
jgi:hypothetical protein